MKKYSNILDIPLIVSKHTFTHFQYHTTLKWVCMVYYAPLFQKRLCQYVDLNMAHKCIMSLHPKFFKGFSIKVIYVHLKIACGT